MGDGIDMFEAGQRFDKYTIAEKLGEGGMATVYRADSPFGLPVVLKILNASLAGEAEVLERFRREGRIQFSLRHPHIVRVTDIVEDHGVPALVADFLKGKDLEAALNAGQRFELPDILSIATKVLDALQVAHDAGFVHRDIKPSNLFLEDTDYGFEPRLMDFGIAKAEEAAALTRAQEFCGTPAYTSPEQIESTRDVDARSDLYSFGVVLWELLSNRQPYGELTDPISILVQVVKHPLPPLPDRVPRWLVRIVEKALAKKPDQRWQRAIDFHDALLRGAEGDPELQGTVVLDGSGPVLTDASGRPRTDRTLRGTGSHSVAPPVDDPAHADTEPDHGHAVRRAMTVATPMRGSTVVDGNESSVARAWARKQNRPPVDDDESGSHVVAARPMNTSPPQPQRRPEPEKPAPSSKKKDKRGIGLTPGAIAASGAAAIILGATLTVMVWKVFAPTPQVPDGFVRIEPGTFEMGSPVGEPGRGADEGLHEVTLTYPFAIMTHEVTVGQFESVSVGRSNPFRGCGPECPVINVSFMDAVEFANMRSQQDGFETCYRLEGAGANRTITMPDGLACRGYRLPTEAEWEYAARAGTTGATWAGEIVETGRSVADPTLAEIAVYGATSAATYSGAVDCSSWADGFERCGPAPVGSLEANPWGLYDMLGNVSEWVHDAWGPYPSEAVTDPVRDPAGRARTIRGGSWLDGAEDARAAARESGAAVGRMHVGFRLARTLRR